MPGSESNPTDRWQNALNVFTDWLQGREQRANFEALCAGTSVRPIEVLDAEKPAA